MIAAMYFRTKTVKDTALVQLVDSDRNAQRLARLLLRPDQTAAKRRICRHPKIYRIAEIGRIRDGFSFRLFCKQRLVLGRLIS
jgi:hypothetical protein